MIQKQLRGVRTEMDPLNKPIGRAGQPPGAVLFSGQLQSLVAKASAGNKGQSNDNYKNNILVIVTVNMWEVLTVPRHS